MNWYVTKTGADEAYYTVNGDEVYIFNYNIMYGFMSGLTIMPIVKFAHLRQKKEIYHFNKNDRQEGDFIKALFEKKVRNE